MRPQPRYSKGDRIGNRYQVHKALLGGMGEVYLCLDLETMQPYALKTFQRQYVRNARALEQAFEQEVAIWVALEKHPNIVRCYYMDTLDNQPFMVLEWVAGEKGRGTDLRSWLRRGPLDLQIALEIAIDVCRGLLYAQEKQPDLVHRDLKPENILVAQGGLAKVTDFGLAQVVQTSGVNPGKPKAESHNRHSMLIGKGIVGTPDYMPPEQWQGIQLDERADVYALGCMLYEMLAGRPPFAAGFYPTTEQEQQRWLRVMQAAHEAKARDALPATAPTTVAALVDACLAKSPADRPSVAELMSKLCVYYKRELGQILPQRPAPGVMTAMDYSNRGLTYCDLQRYEAALTDHNRALALDPNDAKTYINRARTYYDLRQYEAALADYDRSLELDPNFAPTYVSRGSIYHDLQRYATALSDYDRALELDPNLAQAYSNRGNTLTALQEYKAALSDHNRAISLDPKVALAYHNRGVTYVALQQYEAALFDYNRAIELDPNFTQAYVNRGAIYNNMRQYSVALDDHKRALDLDPNDSEIYYNRGLTYQALMQYELALVDYRRALTLNPNFALAYLNIGTVLGNLGILHEALPYFEKAAQLGHPQGAQYAAQVQHMLGMKVAPTPDPAEAAFAALQYVDSIDAMRQTVTAHPLLLDANMIAAIEQVMAQQIPSQQRHIFRQRLDWLRQIAAEQS